ncbi:MAG: hypothetical protein PVI41_00435 [Roseobacter sp.]|jgi:ketosteroid isomerase-like protein
MPTRDELQVLLDEMARAYAAGNAEACAKMFARNAQLHSPFGAPAIGRADIKSLHEQWTAEPSAKAFTILDHGSSNTLAWCLCRFDEGEGNETGTSLFVLEKDDGGSWLIRSCCLHGDPETA